MRTLLSILFVSCILKLTAQNEDKILVALQSTPNVVAASAQNPYNKSMSDSYELVLHADMKSVEKELKSFVQAQCGVSLKGSKGVLTHPMAVVRTVSTDSLSLAAMLEKQQDGVKLIMLATRNDVPLSLAKDSVVMKEVKLLTERFAKRFYRDHYQRVIASEQKQLDKLKKEVSGLESKAGKQEDAENKAKGKISSAESNIRKAENDAKAAESGVKKAESEKERIQRDLDLTTAEIEKNKIELNGFQAQVDALNASGNTDSREFKKAMKELAKRQKLDQKLYAQLQKHNKSISKLDKTINKEKGRVSDAENVRRKNESAIKDQENTLRDADRELSSLSKDLQEAREKMSIQEDVLNRLNNALAGVPKD